MVLVGLYVKVDAEPNGADDNGTELKTLTIANDAIMCFTIQESNGAETRENVSIDPAEQLDLPTGHGTTNCLIRFAGSHSVNTINFEGDAGVVDLQKNDWQLLRTFECRGAEPVKFNPGSGFSFTYQTHGGKTHTVELDLGEEMPFEYFCEVSNSLISINSVDFKFDKIKGGKK